MNPPSDLATRIVAALISDLSGRSGLGDVFEDCEPDIQREIETTWVELVEGEIEHSAGVIAAGEAIRPLIDLRIESAPLIQAHMTAFTIKTPQFLNPPVVPTLTEYSEQRFARELYEVSPHIDGSFVRACIARSKEVGHLAFVGCNTSYVGGIVCWCPQCQRVRVNDGPDTHSYACRTCGTPVHGHPESWVLSPAPAITVRPLVWHAAPYDHEPAAIDHYAVFRGGWLYVIKQRARGVSLYAGNEHPAGSVYPEQDQGYAGQPFATLEAAQAAAAAEWDAFIRAAINPSAQQTAKPEAEQ